MHAVIVRSTVDTGRLTEAIAGIDAVKDRLRGMRGFAGAHWFEPLAGAGLMVSLWEDEAAATGAAPPVGFSPAPGVTVAAVETRAVVASA